MPKIAGPVTSLSWAPDGTAVYYSTSVTDEGRGRMVRHDVQTGSEKIPYSLDRSHNQVVPTESPDGKFLAFTLQSLLE